MYQIAFWEQFFGGRGGGWNPTQQSYSLCFRSIGLPPSCLKFIRTLNFSHPKRETPASRPLPMGSTPIQNYQKTTIYPKMHVSLLVAEVGVEPTHPCEYTILSRARLPVPPLGLKSTLFLITFCYQFRSNLIILSK